MIHYTCDRCRRSIDPHAEVRYVVEIEIHARMDGLFDEAASLDDRDSLDDVQEVLDAHLESQTGLVGEDVCRRMQFDLCGDCHRKYSRNPVGRETMTELTFSKN